MQGERPSRFPEERRVQVPQEPGWAADTGEKQCPPSAAVATRLAEAQRVSCRSLALPGPAVGTGPSPAVLTLLPGPRSVPATQERVSTHLLEAYVTPGRRATTGSGESRAPPSQQEAGPTGAHGQRAGAEGKPGARGCGFAPPASGCGREGNGLHPPRGMTRLARGPESSSHLESLPGAEPGQQSRAPTTRDAHAPSSAFGGNLTRWEGPAGRPPDAWGPGRRGPALPVDQAFGGKASGQGEQGP